MSMLELRRVSRSTAQGAAEVHALREVSLTADEGEMVAVMGPSGSGKSTLLTIAGTLEEPTSGEVLIAGQPVSEAVSQRQGAAAAARHRLRIPGLQPAARADRGGERLAAPRARRHVRPQGARPRPRGLERLGLGERAAHYPDQLSGGERQRVAIARAMVGERKLLLADEPSGALDSANAQAVMRLLLDACKVGGMTAVVVTHDAQLASWADRVVFLRDGRVTDQTAAAPGPESLFAQERHQ